MKKIETYFMHFSPIISFIQLNNSSIAEYFPETSIPLPIPTKLLDHIVKTLDEDFAISLEDVFKGILYSVAIDNNFIYKKYYLKALGKLEIPLESFTTKKATDPDNTRVESLLLFRAGYLLCDNNFLNAGYAQKLYEEYSHNHENNFLLKESIKILETIIRNNESFVYAYYELGNIHSRENNFIKANSFYKLALKFSTNTKQKELINKSMVSIEKDVILENSIYFLNKGDYYRAYNELATIDLDHEKRPDMYFYFASICFCMQNYSEAIINFNRSLDLGGDYPDLYIQLSVAYTIKQNIEEALKVLSRGLEKYETNLIMHYNKAKLLILAGEYIDAQEEIDYILQFDDISDELFESVMLLKERIDIKTL